MRRGYHSLGYGKHVVYGLAVHGGSKSLADLGAVDSVWAAGLVRDGLVTFNDDTYTLNEEGWEVFYEGTGYRRDVVGPGHPLRTASFEG